jgi:hypothetical protein
MDTVMRTRGQRERGTEIVEMAVVLPLLLMLVLGAIQYGWLFLKAQQIANAARQGARIAILPDAGAATRAQQTMLSLLTQASLPTTPAPTIEDPYNIDLGGGVICPGIRVQISISTTPLRLINASFLPVPDTLHCTVVMAKES